MSEDNVGQRALRLIISTAALPNDHAAHALYTALLRASPGVFARHSVWTIILQASALSSTAISSLVAAVAVASEGSTNLVLSQAPHLRVLDLEPYIDIVHKARVAASRNGRQFGLRALVADATPLRHIPVAGISVLRDVQCLSVCHTRFSNLWTFVHSLRSLPNLHALFVSEHMSNQQTVAEGMNSHPYADVFAASCNSLLDVDCGNLSISTNSTHTFDDLGRLVEFVSTPVSETPSTVSTFSINPTSRYAFFPKLSGACRHATPCVTDNVSARHFRPCAVGATLSENRSGNVLDSGERFEPNLVTFRHAVADSPFSPEPGLSHPTNRFSGMQEHFHLHVDRNSQNETPSGDTEFSGRHFPNTGKWYDAAQCPAASDCSMRHPQLSCLDVTEAVEDRMNLDSVVSLANRAIADYSASNAAADNRDSLLESFRVSAGSATDNINSDSDFNDEPPVSQSATSGLSALYPQELSEKSSTPISLHLHYRQFLITQLCHLRILDSVIVTRNMRESAAQTCKDAFQLRSRQGRRRVSLLRQVRDRELLQQRRISWDCLQTDMSPQCYAVRGSLNASLSSKSYDGNRFDEDSKFAGLHHTSSPMSCPTPAVHKRPREPSLCASSPSSPSPLNMVSSAVFDGSTASPLSHQEFQAPSLGEPSSSTSVARSTSHACSIGDIRASPWGHGTSSVARTTLNCTSLQQGWSIRLQPNQSTRRASKRPALVSSSTAPPLSAASSKCPNTAIADTPCHCLEVSDREEVCAMSRNPGLNDIGCHVNDTPIAREFFPHDGLCPDYDCAKDLRLFATSRQISDNLSMDLSSYHSDTSSGLMEDFSCGKFAADAHEEILHRAESTCIDQLTQRFDRPRQFEYNPNVPGQLVYGTLNGTLVVLNQETREVVGACRHGGGAGHRNPGTLVPRSLDSTLPADSTPGSAEDVGSTINQMRHSFDWMSVTDSTPLLQGPLVLGLSWLHKRPNLFLAGTAAGDVHLYNVDWMGSGYKGGCVRACDGFEYLTSIHVSSDDRHFVVSGNSRDVGLFDLETGVRLEDLYDCHDMHINVLKFSNHNPNVFATSSFDRYVKKWDLRESRPGGARRPIFERCSDQGNVMVCFSPDDEYLLVSAIDNEVRQYTAGDGRLHHKFDIPQTKKADNYTRSYYMNDRDYIITGSCKEDIVRIYNARSGQLFREMEIDCHRSGLVFVQSLRANPHKDYNLSVLLACEGVAGGHDSASTSFEALANVDLMGRASSICPEYFGYV